MLLYVLVVWCASLVGVLGGGERPDPLHAVVEGGLGAVRGRVPDAHRAVLAAADDHGQPAPQRPHTPDSAQQLRGTPSVRGQSFLPWVEDDCGHVVRVALEGLHAGFGLVVPDLDLVVVRARQQVRLHTPTRPPSPA